MTSSGDDILFERRGAAGIVTLNRPKALNAVTRGMVRALRAELDRWASDPAITRVVILAAGGRAFSAGGDIRALYDLGRANRIDDALQFWRDEYPLNLVIKNYRKPYVAMIDGIAMGGGVGVSVHGSHRVAGDRFSFAMPEVGIGFFPDVGATWFLPRMPGELGAYCALTGDRFTANDAVSSGIATHRIASAQFEPVLDGLTGTASVDAVLAAFAIDPATPWKKLKPAQQKVLLEGARDRELKVELTGQRMATTWTTRAWPGAGAPSAPQRSAISALKSTMSRIVVRARPTLPANRDQTNGPRRL